MTTDTDTNTFESRILSAYSATQYANRIAWGEDALDSNPDREANDDETTASDVISDILTALYGPAGYFRGRDRVSCEEAEARARQLIERGFESWLGDAEDYSETEDD